MKYERCPVCAAPARLWRTKSWHDKVFRIERCTGCGYAFVNPRPTPAFLREFYATAGHGEEHTAMTAERVLRQEEEYPNSTLDAGRMIGIIDELAPRHRVRRLLDVGCGYGLYSRAALRAGFEVEAIEPATVERGIAIVLTGVQPCTGSFEEFQGGDFAAVLMSHILEHALDVNEWMVKARALLVPGGVLAIALPNFGSAFRMILQERDPYVCPPAHLNYFTRHSLQLLLERHDFRVLRTEWVSRLPAASIERRLAFLGPAARPARLPLDLVLPALDRLRLGMTLHMYARLPAR